MRFFTEHLLTLSDLEVFKVFCTCITWQRDNVIQYKQNLHENVLTRLVRGLETKKTLLRVEDYLEVKLEVLICCVKKLGPPATPFLASSQRSSSTKAALFHIEWSCCCAL